MIGCLQHLHHHCIRPHKNRPELMSVCDTLSGIHSSVFFHSNHIKLISNMAKPRVFFDITIDGKSAGRIVMEVR